MLRLPLVSCALMLTACSSATALTKVGEPASPAPYAPIVAIPEVSATPGPTFRPESATEAAGELHYMGIDFSHPIRQYGDCTEPGWGGTPTLRQVLRSQGDLATAAIMTVIGPSASPQWNTPDGHRWTQPEAIAARQHGIIPAIEAPWRFQRTGPNFVGAVPDSVTVWLIGGKVGQDWTYGGNCIAGEEDPMPGSSYLMFFGPQQNLTPGAYRVILAAYPYDPVTHALDGPWGRVWLAPPPATMGRSG